MEKQLRFYLLQLYITQMVLADVVQLHTFSYRGKITHVAQALTLSCKCFTGVFGLGRSVTYKQSYKNVYMSIVLKSNDYDKLFLPP